MRNRHVKLMVAVVGAGSLTLSIMAQTTPNGSIDKEVTPQMAAMMAAAKGQSANKEGELPKFKDISKDYKKVVSTADGAKSLYTLWKRDKDAQVLAELPTNFEKQRLFIAYNIAGGVPMAGVQVGDMYVVWKRYDKKLALIEPNVAVRTSGDHESKQGHNRVFTDRVVLEVPIVAMGPGGGPVIDMDALLVGQASKFSGMFGASPNPTLVKIVKAKAFPENVELAFELPLRGGRFGELYYSIKLIPENTSYKPRAADERVGFFTTTYRDIGKPGADTPWVRYINRWKLEKADPKLKMSPPKEPIVFYLEHTMPVRYRRWVREGVLEWNKAYEQIGLVNAIEVYQQDSRTGAHMDKDPEDTRYNFILWTNASMGFAIGPSRVDPKTGQILDADIVMDEGFISGWVNTWRKVIPQTAMEGFGPETLSWLEDHPTWDPRVRLAPATERNSVIAKIQAQRAMRGTNLYGSHPAAMADPTLLGDDEYDGLYGRISQTNGLCMNAMAKGLEVSFFRMNLDAILALAVQDKDDDDDSDEDADADDDDAEEEKGDMLDGVPDWFIGPLLKDVVMHEVGHTLGLRHNFKASTIHSLKEINNEDFKGQAQTASVMDYNPININMEDGPEQGDYTMVTIGPYDYWAMEYGYTFEKDLKPILARASEGDVPYMTDEDTWGPDPEARRFDYGADSLKYAESQMRLVNHLRGKILDSLVKDGDSWAKARQGYEMLLWKHFGTVGIAANWIGGAHLNRDKKGDPGDRNPIEIVSAKKQRRALKFIIDNMFIDKAFGLNDELLSKMTVDKWWDDGGMGTIFEDNTWPVHDRIMGLQASALTMILNPTTLRRVFDNEFALPADEDALTLPELMFTVSDAVWTEISETPGKRYTSRKPMISSLRRNLQREHISRLIDLSLAGEDFAAAAKPIANLAAWKLRELSSKIESIEKRNGTQIDPYTLAHLSEAKIRIDKALDADYVYNLNDIQLNLGLPTIMFGENGASPQH